MNHIYRVLNVPGVTMALIAIQVLAFLMIATENIEASAIDLQANKVMAGEFWRLFTFAVLPPTDNFLFVIFAWLLLYIYGNSLEHYWGAGKYNTFLLTGFLVSIGVAFIIPQVAIGNLFLITAVFLTFSFYNPNFEILLFFILPVKIKWLALLAVLGLLYVFFAGNIVDKLIVFAATANIFIFVGPDFLMKLRGKKNQVKHAIEAKIESGKAFHTCIVCGKTDKTHPQMKFRYCSLCDGSPCYCEEHIEGHEHIKAEAES